MAAPALDAAVSAFRKTLERLESTAGRVADGGEVAEPGAPLELGPELGERAALMAVAGQLWRHHLGPMLTSADLQKLGGRSRQAVHEMAQRGRLLAVPGRRGAMLFPAFQLDPTGRPHPAVPKVLAAFADTGVSPLTIASWFRTAHPLLDGRTPAEQLAAGGDPELVERAARRTASKLRR